MTTIKDLRARAAELGMTPEELAHAIRLGTGKDITDEGPNSSIDLETDTGVSFPAPLTEPKYQTTEEDNPLNRAILDIGSQGHLDPPDTFFGPDGRLLDPKDRVYRYDGSKPVVTEAMRMSHLKRAAMVIPNVALGVPLGIVAGGSALMGTFAQSIHARLEVAPLMKRLEEDGLTQNQRNAIIYRIQDIGDGLRDTDPVYRAYADLDRDTAERFDKDSAFSNFVSDLTEVSKSFPMLMGVMVEAAIAENPKAMAELGVTMIAGGVGSTISMLEPSKFLKNLQARPVSLVLTAAPVARILLKSPAALQALKGKFTGKKGEALDFMLKGLDKFDTGVKDMWRGVADLPVGKPKGLYNPGSMGKANIDVVRVGEKGLVHAGERVTNLVPGQKFKTIGDLTKSFVKGATHGMFVGEPVASGLVYLAAKTLYPNTKMTRSIATATAQWLRHTSAQSNASQELAVRGLMMASAAQRSKVRMIADKIAKEFDGDLAALASENPDLIAMIPAGRVELWRQFQGDEFVKIRPDEIQVAINKLEREAQAPDISKADRATVLKSLETLKKENPSLSAKNVGTKDTAIPLRAAELADEIGAMATELGVSGPVAEALKFRMANIADRGAILLQDRGVAHAVIKELSDLHGLPRDKAIALIGDLADDPLFGTKSVSSKVVVNGQTIDINNIISGAVDRMPLKQQRQIQAGAASSAAMRYSALLSDAAFSRAMRSEATKGNFMGRALEGVPFDQITPEAYTHALAGMLARKDVMEGGMGLPTAIPFSVDGGKRPAALSSSLRILANDEVNMSAILSEKLGSAPTPVELRNFSTVLNNVADEFSTYQPVKGSSLKNEILKSLADDPNAPKDMQKLAKGLSESDFYVAPGLKNDSAGMLSSRLNKGTLNWHREMLKGATLSSRGSRWVKGNLTYRNPISHANNSMGNAGLLMVKFGEDPVTFGVNAARDSKIYLNYKNRPAESSRRHISDADMSPVDLRSAEIFDMTNLSSSDYVMAELYKQAKSGGLGGPESQAMMLYLDGLKGSALGKKLKGAATATDDFVGKLYGLEDNIPKLRLGMQQARNVLSDLEVLSEGHPYRLPTSDVSTTLLTKGPDGRIYKGKYKAGKRPLSDADLNKVIASHVRKTVNETLVNYTELSGLNRKVNDAPVIGAAVPFFTFFNKAKGSGGRKGFLETTLASTDGIVTTDPRILTQQINKGASLALRRALLVNSMRQFGSRERELLGRALAFDPSMPSMVIFNTMTDPEALSYRDYQSMNSFAPAETKYRIWAYMAGLALKAAIKTGAVDRDDLSKQQRRFLGEMDTGQVAGLITLGAITGVGRGPGLNSAELILNGGKDRYGNQVDLKRELARRVLPAALPSPIAVALTESLSNIEGLDTLSGRQRDDDDDELDESRITYLLRRTAYLGGRKARYDDRKNVFSVYQNKKRHVKGNFKVLRESLDKRINKVADEIDKLERKLESSSIDLLVAKDIRGNIDGLRSTLRNFERTESRIDDVQDEELDRLDDAYNVIQVREKILKQRKGKR